MSVVIPTVDDLQATGQAAIQAANETLTDFSTGSFLDAVTAVSAMGGEEVLRIVFARAATLFFGTAVGDDLDALLLDRFGGNLARQGETAAYGPIVFSRPTTDAGDILIPAGTEVFPSSSPTLRYVTRADVTLSGLSIAAVVDCATAGTAGNLDVDKLDTLSASLADTSITVTNEERIAGGAPAQTDDEVKAAIKTYYQNLSKGVKAALVLGAQQVDGVRVALVDETHAAAEDGGYVEVFVSDPDGNSNSTMTDAVLLELDNWRAAGVFVRVTGITVLELEAAVTVYLTSPDALGTVTPEIQAALAASCAGLEPGATIYTSQLDRVAIGVSPADKGGVIKGANVTITVNGTPYPAPNNPHVASDRLPRLAGTAVTVEAG